jgi:hypothetical protein
MDARRPLTNGLADVTPLPAAFKVAGFVIAIRDGRIYLTEVDNHDTGLKVTDATALAVALRAAAQQAIRQARAER